MRIVLVSRVGMNPYVRLLGDALEHAGPDVSCAHEQALNSETVRRWHGKADVFHVHWAELLCRSRSAPRSLLRLAQMSTALMQAKRAGMAIVYTAHNVQLHEGGANRIDVLANDMLYRLADAVHVHDDEAKRELLARSHPARVAVIPHGNYIGAYPDTCSRDEARQRLGLAAGSFVFLALGQIRPYKGLDGMIAAFRSVQGSNLRLVIAGHAHDPAYGEALKQLAAGDDRIQIQLAFVPDQDVQYYMRAADACVLPYRSGTTSGAAILALSFGVPIIAPDAYPFRPLVGDGGGWLYPAQPQGLANALSAAAQADTAQAGAAALAAARRLDWELIARQHLALYREILGSRRRDG